MSDDAAERVNKRLLALWDEMPEDEHPILVGILAPSEVEGFARSRREVSKKEYERILAEAIRRGGF